LLFTGVREEQKPWSLVFRSLKGANMTSEAETGLGGNVKKQRAFLNNNPLNRERKGKANETRINFTKCRGRSKT
jgi:hypothetical protein